MMSTQKFNDWPDEDVMNVFIRHRDQQAFSQIYQKYFPQVSKYIAWLSNDVEKGKDIAQNIFLKIYHRPNSYDPSRNFKVWLFTIAKNQSKNEFRNEAIRAKHLELLKQESSFQSTDPKETEHKLALVRAAMNHLSESHKETFILKYSNNLSIKEISEICDCSEGTVKSRLFYALKHLKEKLNLASINKL